MQVEVAALEGDVELRLDPLPVVGDLADVGMEHGPIADAGRAGVLESQVRAPQKQDGIDAVLRHGDDADRHVDRLLVRRQIVWLHQLGDQPLGDDVHRHVEIGIRVKNREFAGADAANDDIVGKARLKPPGKGTHQFVALAVADRFIDLLETADVDVDEEDRLAGPDRGLRRLGDPADHGRPREQACQLVEMGLLDDIAHRLVDPGEEGHRSAAGGQRAKRRQ